jgi:hypothetical protein
LQNRAPGLIDAPQEAQINSNFVPHSSQNDASGGLSFLHFAHSIDQSLDFIEQHLRVLQVASTGSKPEHYDLSNTRRINYLFEIGA